MIDTIGDKCTGCSACANRCPVNCIKMVSDKEGFLYPEINDSICIHCNQCEKACPVLSPIPIQGTEDDVDVYALINTDDEIRRNSSSGGAFSAIASYVLDEGGVVYGAAFDDDFSVKHICIESNENLFKLRGSKYVQSEIGNCYKEAEKQLKDGRLVLFTGTACQTSGLLGYLGRDYDNLITQDLICHGVPSPMVWKRYVEFRKKLERSDIKRIFFRDKAYGWHDWHVLFEFTDGAIYSQNQREDFMVRAFLRGTCSRKSCYNCPFKQKVRLADFTLADFWGIEKILPEMDDDRGVSSVYANTEKAHSIMKKLEKTCQIQRVDFDLTLSYNMAMVESEKLNPKREDFIRDVKLHSFDRACWTYNDQVSFRTKIRWTLRRWLGSPLYDKLRKRIGG